MFHLGGDDSGPTSQRRLSSAEIHVLSDTCPFHCNTISAENEAKKEVEHLVQKAKSHTHTHTRTMCTTDLLLRRAFSGAWIFFQESRLIWVQKRTHIPHSMHFAPLGPPTPKKTNNPPTRCAAAPLLFQAVGGATPGSARWELGRSRQASGHSCFESLRCLVVQQRGRLGWVCFGKCTECFHDFT